MKNLRKGIKVKFETEKRNSGKGWKEIPIKMKTMRKSKEQMLKVKKRLKKVPS